LKGLLWLSAFADETNVLSACALFYYRNLSRLWVRIEIGLVIPDSHYIGYRDAPYNMITVIRVAYV